MKIDGRKALVGEAVEVLSLEQIILQTAAAVKPPERLTTSQAATKYRKLNNSGSYVGPWLNSKTPYLVEPMDELNSLDYTGWCFVGPAQCGKTDMALNWITYTVKCDPADLMIVQTSNVTARDFSIRRIDRLHRHSPEVGAMLLPGKHGDNTFDKMYRGGMILSLSWPSINELSGKPIPRLWLTDYDRMEQNVDGEGSPFDLARKRATSFRSFGMCAAESSPGFTIQNTSWRPSTPHEAPPTTGILAIYNRGDRRRWMWRCVRCGSPFEPSFDLLKYPETNDFMEAAEAAVLQCPHCQFEYSHDPNDHAPGKHELNQLGRWVREGVTWMPDGSMVGTPVRSSIASFWMKGVAAAFSDWKTLVFNYLTAEREYENTQSEEALKSTVNTDQGEPYMPKSAKSDRTPDMLKELKRDVGTHVVPPGVRFLIAAIDVQKRRFVVQILGIAANGDRVVIDRFDIKKSKRLSDEGDREDVWPGSYLEDWKLIMEEVLMRKYPLSDNSGRAMEIKLTLCDSGGKEGVTANAYNFVRWLRRGDTTVVDDEDQGEGSADPEKAEEGEYVWKPGYAGRFMLTKGASTANVPRVQVVYPDSQRKDRNAGARGEIPVMLLNTQQLKDIVNNRLERKEAGGRYQFADWLPENFFIELTVEVKDPKKGWINPKKFRNESWDLLAYAEAATLSPMIQFDHLDLADAPGWARPWDENELVVNTSDSAPGGIAKAEDPLAKLARLAESLG